MDRESTKLLQLFICPTLIGRDPDLANLQMLIRRRRSSEGPTVLLISGEAGIGKSRLVAEAKTLAAHQGFLLLEGQCFQSDSLVPYAPLLDFFRSYFAHYTQNDLPNHLHSFVATLTGLLPDLALLFPNLATAHDLAQSSKSPEEEKRRLIAAMIHFLTEQTTQQPVLVVVEDVHWGDDLSLEFLLHLVRRCRNIPFLLLVTYRSEVTPSEVRQWLTELDRERLAQEISLGPLSRSDIDRMVQTILGLKHTVEAELLETLYTLSEGNPFFVEELLKTLMTTGKLQYFDGGWVGRSPKAGGEAFIPPSVQVAVQQRVERLSSEAKQVLTLAAVAGRRFDFTLLQKALHCDEDYLLSLIKELMTAQLVVENSVDHFAFRHALIREAIYSQLLRRERQALHRTLVKVLLLLPSAGERYLGDLAKHCYEAGMWEQAALYEYQLGEQAVRLYAQRTTIKHLTRAIEVSRYLASPLPSKFHYARGQAYTTLGEFDHAQSDYEQALELANKAGEGLMEWQVMLAIGFLWFGRDYTKARGWLRQSIELAERLADPALKAHSLNRLGNWLANTGRLEEGLQAHGDALKIFEEQQNPQGMAETLDLLATAYGMGGNRIKAVEQLGQAIDLFRSQNNLPSLSSSLAMRAIQAMPGSNETTFCSLRTRDECVQDATEALNLARQLNSLPGQAFAQNALGNILLSFGDFGSALWHVQKARRIATDIEHQQWLVATAHGLGQIYLQLFALPEALTALEVGLAWAKKLGSHFWVSSLATVQARVHLLKHDLTTAQAILQAIMSPQQPPRNLPERQIALVWGELLLAQGQADLALQIAEQLLASVPGELPDQPSQLIPHLLKLKGEAQLALHCPAEAVVTLEKARQGANERNARPILWAIQRSLVQTYQHLQRPEQAQEEGAAVRQLILELATTISDETLRNQFEQSALASMPKVKLLPTNKHAFGGLTPREREVAILIAHGKTSREIAEMLIVTKRTAEVHVSNILGKLGFSSRSQIAVWVVENGLANR